MKFETKGIGTTWWIEIFDQVNDTSIFDEVKNHIVEFDRKYSRFNSASIIHKLNTKKVITDFPEELFAMLSYCQSMSKLTDYRFNVCSGAIQESNGYDEFYSFHEKNKPDLQYVRHGLRVLEKNKIEINPNVTIDLGGIGKGWLLDTIKLLLNDTGFKYFSINGGGDIYVSSDCGKPVKFFLENPFNSQEYIGTIDLINASLACSSPTRRSWTTYEGGKFHHLINAQEGRPADHVQAIFTYGTTGLAADTASTCMFISPFDEIDRIADELDVEYLVILPDGRFTKSEGFIGELH